MQCRTCQRAEAATGSHDCKPCARALRENLDVLRGYIRVEAARAPTATEGALGAPHAHYGWTGPELAAAVEYRARGAMREDWMLYVPGSHLAAVETLAEAGRLLGCGVGLAAAEDCLVILGLRSRWPARPRGAWEIRAQAARDDEEIY